MKLYQCLTHAKRLRLRSIIRDDAKIIVLLQDICEDGEMTIAGLEVPPGYSKAQRVAEAWGLTVDTVNFWEHLRVDARTTDFIEPLKLAEARNRGMIPCSPAEGDYTIVGKSWLTDPRVPDVVETARRVSQKIRERREWEQRAVVCAAIGQDTEAVAAAAIHMTADTSAFEAGAAKVQADAVRLFLATANRIAIDIVGTQTGGRAILRGWNPVEVSAEIDSVELRQNLAPADVCAERWGIDKKSIDDWRAAGIQDGLRYFEPEFHAIYRRDRSAALSVPVVCPECKGTGEYRGLLAVEPCRACRPQAG